MCYFPSAGTIYCCCFCLRKNVHLSLHTKLEGVVAALGHAIAARKSQLESSTEREASPFQDVWRSGKSLTGTTVQTQWLIGTCRTCSLYCWPLVNTRSLSMILAAGNFKLMSRPVFFRKIPPWSMVVGRGRFCQFQYAQAQKKQE